ncbi:MAG: hypothetical protein FWE80_03490 [Oscillospiraceae bacterium]|nr:hypothetical protein [Oscillospiraceae bacterium]
MINNIPAPKISKGFTIDDIHKIREWHYEKMKDATADERRKEAEENIRWFRKRMKESAEDIAAIKQARTEYDRSETVSDSDINWN